MYVLVQRLEGIKVYLRLFASLVIAYFIGAISFSDIIARRFYYGTDLRQHGSGGLGATNAFRTFGIGAGVTVFVLDGAKGAVCIFIAMWLLGASSSPFLLLLVMMIAVLGHSFSLYVGFKGGKGVSTAIGALFFMWPIVAAILMVIWGTVLLASRYVSLASMVATFAFPFLLAVFYPQSWGVYVLAGLASGFVIYKHKANIGRLLEGTESRIGGKSTAT